jgi:preprotein translocase subunit YajC
MCDNVHTMKRKLLYTLSSLWLLLVLFVFTILNPARCPHDYTQAQVDSSGCIVGANIGLGLMVLFVILPLTFMLAVAWIFVLRGKRKK